MSKLKDWDKMTVFENGNIPLLAGVVVLEN